MSKYNLVEIEKLLQQGIPIGTVFDFILKYPYRYCLGELAKDIIKNQEQYKTEFDNLRLKNGYFEHLGGTHILKRLFQYGFPENLITKYIVYPLTYQFRTHLPFVDQIRILDKCPILSYCSSPILEKYLGVRELKEGDFCLPVVRYGIPGGGTEFEETPEDICGTFYYPEPESDVILKFHTALIVPNKIIAYSYLLNKTLKDIIQEFVKIDDYSYSEEPDRLKSKGSGFNSYYIIYDDNDATETYNLIKSHLTEDIETLKDLIFEIFPLNDYFDDLVKRNEGENFNYEYKGEIQKKDLVLFSIFYVKYCSIKMMLNDTWNWRVNTFGPYTAYDQIICKEAKKKSIDIILLVTEVSTGMYSIKTEVMDTRSRKDSYDNLYIKNDPIILRRRQNEKEELKQALEGK